MISNYLDAQINYFDTEVIDDIQYDECLKKLHEIHNILSKKNLFIPSEEHPINIEIYEKDGSGQDDDDEDYDDDRYGQQIMQYSQQSNGLQPQQQFQQATINQKLLKKRNAKKNKNSYLKKTGQVGALAQPQMIGAINNDSLGISENSEAYFDQIPAPIYNNQNNDANNNSIEVKKKKKKKKKSKAAATAAAASAIANGKANGSQDEGVDVVDEDGTIQLNSAEKAKKGEGKKKGSACPMNDELEQFQRRLEESNKNLKEHQKIQPKIAQDWILKVKERYAKLKIKLNK